MIFIAKKKKKSLYDREVQKARNLSKKKDTKSQTTRRNYEKSLEGAGRKKPKSKQKKISDVF